MVIEEFLEGEEASLFALVDGPRAIPLASAQERQRELLEAKWIAGTDGVTGEAAA